MKLALLLPILVGLSLANVPRVQLSAQFGVVFWSLALAAIMCLFPQCVLPGLLIMPLAALILFPVGQLRGCGDAARPIAGRRLSPAG